MAEEIDDSPEPMPKVIFFLSSLLRRFADFNDRDRRFNHQQISVFDGVTRPNISIKNYLERIFKYANCSPSCFVVAYVYLDRFSQRQPLLPLNSFNVHRLLIASVLVSAKFMEDSYYNNAYYAKVGGISTREMNLLEMDFLFGLGFDLFVTPNTFHTYSSHLHTQQQIYDIEKPFHYHCFNVNDDDSSTSTSTSTTTTNKKQLIV